jgi:hypothetical protein
MRRRARYFGMDVMHRNDRGASTPDWFEFGYHGRSSKVVECHRYNVHRMSSLRTQS